MPWCLRVAVSLSLAFVSFAAFSAAEAQIVRTGLDVTFTKPDAAPSAPENQDRLTLDVWIARGFAGGVYNAKVESSFPTRDPDATSPAMTEWATSINNPGATIGAANWSSLTFDTWLNAYGGIEAAGPATVNVDAVLRIVRDDPELDDIYLDIKFTSWSASGAGGFAYMRSKLTDGDYNLDGLVDAADYTVWRDALGQTVTTPGDGADGDFSGTIDAGDFEYWKFRFGDVVPQDIGAGHGGIVPEPSAFAIIIMLGGLIGFNRRRRVSPRGPGQSL